METAIDYHNAGRVHVSRLLQCAGTLFIALSLVISSGCSVYMASHQPPKKDTTLLTPGTPRGLLVAELGQPVATETKDNKHIDFFSFVQGSSENAKTSRAFFYGTADLLTLGLFEVVSTPAELVLTGDKVTYEVTYDADDRVEKVQQLGKETSTKPAEPSPNAPFAASYGTKQ